MFSEVSVKFGGGNRFGLIGANGCGKSTFMKILGGEEEFLRAADLDGSRFRGDDGRGSERERVLDVVLQGRAEMWKAMCERDEIYADAEAGEEAFLRAALAAA